MADVVRVKVFYLLNLVPQELALLDLEEVGPIDLKLQRKVFEELMVSLGRLFSRWKCEQMYLLLHRSRLYASNTICEGRENT